MAAELTAADDGEGDRVDDGAGPTAGGVPGAVQDALRGVDQLQELLLQERPYRKLRYYTMPLAGSRSSREPLRASQILRSLTWTLSELARTVAVLPAHELPAPLAPTLRRLTDAVAQRLPADRREQLAGPATSALMLQLQTELHRLLLECATDAQLAFYTARDLAGAGPGRRIAVDHFGADAVHRIMTSELSTLTNDPGAGAAGPPRPGIRREAVLVLQHVAERRTDEELSRAARSQVRAERQEWVGGYLLWLLVGAMGLLVLAMVSAGDPESVTHVVAQVLTVAVFGMLGGAISIVRELRSGDNTSSGYKRAVSAQILVSGVLGVLALLLLQVGVLPGFQAPEPAGTLATSVIYAFLAGYSEPFVIGVVQSLTGAKEDPAAGPADDRRDRGTTLDG